MNDGGEFAVIFASGHDAHGAVACLKDDDRDHECGADTSSKPWFEETWKGKVFGGFTNSASINGDKLNTLQYFVLLAGQHGGLWVSLAMKPANVKASQRDDLNRMGSYIAPMTQCDADAAPDEMSSGDLETCRLYGARVADVATRLLARPAA